MKHFQIVIYTPNIVNGLEVTLAETLEDHETLDNWKVTPLETNVYQIDFDLQAREYNWVVATIESDLFHPEYIMSYKVT